jgi:small subunit ribosomal protein S19
MTRSLWKGPFSDISLSISNVNGTTQQQIWSRRSVILPQFIGKQFMIHNGKTFIPLKVTPDMVGHKMGEFATTRKKPIHKKKNKK